MFRSALQRRILPTKSVKLCLRNSSNSWREYLVKFVLRHEASVGITERCFADKIYEAAS
jgi:hypothetical protein